MIPKQVGIDIGFDEFPEQLICPVAIVQTRPNTDLPSLAPTRRAVLVVAEVLCPLLVC